MTSPTRRSVLTALGVGLVTAGCVGAPGRTGTDESTGTTATTTTATTTTTSATSTTSETTDGTTTDGTTTDGTTTDARTTTHRGTAHAADQPDPDHRVTVTNRADEARTVRTRVVRQETGETVFDETREVPAGTEVEVYNLKQADPEGIEGFRVCGRLVDSEDGTATTASEESERRDCETLRTSECYADAHVTVQEDGSLAVIYAIC